MDVAALLTDAFNRVQESVHSVVEGLSADELVARPDAEANSVAWLVWHLSRVEDDHLAGAFDRPQLWDADGWEGRFALRLPPGSTGYGHTSEEVASVRVEDGSLLAGYYDAVHARTLELIGDLTPADLDRVVDTSWTPHVSLGVRLVSVVNDTTQHVGQAAFVRGLVRRAEG
jgi:uncharacterized damage-inducible protein DinB